LLAEDDYRPPGLAVLIRLWTSWLYCRRLMSSDFEAAILTSVVLATAYIGWFAVLDKWLEPSWWRLVGRMLGVRIERSCFGVGLLKIRTWAAVPADHPRASTVIVIGAVSTLTLALCPAVAAAVMVRHVGLSPSWAATVTLVSVLIFPIGAAARITVEGPARFDS
jgi:hypothetical protein